MASTSEGKDRGAVQKYSRVEGRRWPSFGQRLVARGGQKQKKRATGEWNFLARIRSPNLWEATTPQGGAFADEHFCFCPKICLLLLYKNDDPFSDKNKPPSGALIVFPDGRRSYLEEETLGFLSSCPVIIFSCCAYLPTGNVEGEKDFYCRTRINLGGFIFYKR